MTVHSKQQANTVSHTTTFTSTHFALIFFNWFHLTFLIRKSLYTFFLTSKIISVNQSTSIYTTKAYSPCALQGLLRLGRKLWLFIWLAILQLVPIEGWNVRSTSFLADYWTKVGKLEVLDLNAHVCLEVDNSEVFFLTEWSSTRAFWLLVKSCHQAPKFTVHSRSSF